MPWRSGAEPLVGTNRTCSLFSWERGRLAHEDALRHKKAWCRAGSLPQV